MDDRVGTGDEASEASDEDGDRGWPDPGADSWSLATDRDRYRLGLRLACSVAAFCLLVWLTRGFLVEVRPRLWPPTGPTSQWATLVTLHAFGYLLVPLMVGSALADFLVGLLDRR